MSRRGPRGRDAAEQVAPANELSGSSGRPLRAHALLLVLLWPLWRLPLRRPLLLEC